MSLGPSAVLLAVLAAGTPRVALIIDDLGKNRAPTEQVIALPAPVACAFLPRATHTRELAPQAHAAGKEVLLHLPMETNTWNGLDPGGVTLHMTEGEFRTAVRAALTYLPMAAGLNNHMGGMLTRHPGHMGWLMEELAAGTGLYFVDSRTSRHSVAAQVAREQGVAYAERDVFLDNERSAPAVRRALDQLARLARRRGHAIAIGHPHRATIEALQEWLATDHGLEIVPVTALLRHAPKEPSP